MTMKMGAVLVVSLGLPWKSEQLSDASTSKTLLFIGAIQ